MLLGHFVSIGTMAHLLLYTPSAHQLQIKANPQNPRTMTLPALRRLEQEILDTINEAFEGLARGPFASLSREVYAVPAVNIRVHDDRYELEMAIPGFGKKDIHIGIKDNTLIVRGERKEEEKKEEKGRLLRQEFQILRFQRAFTLPEDVDPDQIEARYENGILYLTLPRRREEEEEERVIQVK